MALPVFENETLAGVIDLIKMVYVTFGGRLGNEVKEQEIPEKYRQLAEEQRHIMVESVAELDEALLELYLDNQPIAEHDIINAVRRQTIANNIVPVVCGSSYRNIGVQTLLDAIVDYLPSPLEVDIPTATLIQSGETIEIPPQAHNQFAALVFKIVTDRHVGKLVFARIYSGTCKAGSYVLNSTKNKRNVSAAWLRCMPTTGKKCNLPKPEILWPSSG